MDRNEQRQFIKDLTETIVNDIIFKIDSGRIPAEWGGHELREYLAYRFSEQRIGRMGRGRKAEYNNMLRVHNL